MRRLTTVGAVLVVGIAVIGACGSSSKSTKTTSGGGVTVAGGGGGTPVSVGVSDQQGVNGPMTMTVSSASVAAGKVTFTLKNTGTIAHEMIVLKTDTAVDQLTIGADGKVSEDASQGEVSELDAGKTNSVTLDLTAGKYVLVCNIKDHYKMGMRAAFTVT